MTWDLIGCSTSDQFIHQGWQPNDSHLPTSTGTNEFFLLQQLPETIESSTLWEAAGEEEDAFERGCKHEHKRNTKG